MPRLYDLVGHSQGTDRQHPRVNNGSARQMNGLVNRCLRLCAAGPVTGRLAVLRQRWHQRARAAGACRASGRWLRWCTGWWPTVTAPAAVARQRFTFRFATRRSSLSLAAGVRSCRRGDGLQTHRIRPAPLASGQRAPPGRPGPRRREVRERQTRRTTRRIRR